MSSLSSSVSGGCSLHPRAERRAAQELHHDVRLVVLLGELEDRDDVAVLQLGGGPRFAIEARPHLLGVFREVGEHHLDRDFAIEHRIEAAIEHTHAAAPDALEDLVAADLVGHGGLCHHESFFVTSRSGATRRWSSTHRAQHSSRRRPRAVAVCAPGTSMNGPTSSTYFTCSWPICTTSPCAQDAPRGVFDAVDENAVAAAEIANHRLASHWR